MPNSNTQMIQKGKISSIEGEPDRNGDKTTARVLPSTADSLVTRPLTIPWYLRGDMGNLSPGVEVAYAMFEDGTGLILSRMDGEWPGIVPGRSLYRRRPAPERHHRRRIQQRQSCKETQQHPTDLKRGDPMKASGNAAPETCVQNLLKTIRGEVPYERIKGIDRTLIDKPSGTAANDLAADVEFVVETYEPRVRLSSSDLVALVAQTGDFELRASIDNNTL